MSDDRIFRLIFVFFHKFGRAGEGDLIDIFFYLIRGHAETVIGNDNLFFGGTQRNGNAVFVLGGRRLAQSGQMLVFLNRVYAVGDQLPDKDILIGVEPFFDNGK